MTAVLLIRLKNDVTLLAHMPHHAPVKFYTVTEKMRMYLSQNSTCNLNNYPHLLTRNFTLVIKSAFV